LGDLVLGPLVLRWYALAYIVGLLLGWRYMMAMVRNERLWGDKPGPATVPQIDDFLFWATLGVILGGRIGYVLFYMLPSANERLALAEDLTRVFKIWEGGMSFHGGLIGVGIAIYLFARRHKIPLLSLADLAAAVTPIGLGLGRLANFVNAELYGRESDAPWAMQFPVRDQTGAITHLTAARHPSQLYEAFLEGLVLFVIVRFATHNKLTLTRPGLTTGIFLMGYGWFRFFVEFVREPDAQMPAALRQYLTMGMLLCLPMIAIGAWLILQAAPRKPPEAPTTAEAS
jgi:phosphatidylglycerol:prolipoprotein diacylglycerol transferase